MSNPGATIRSWTEPYGSDLKLFVEAPSAETAYAEAVLALGRLLAKGELEVREEYTVQLQGPDREALLVALLEEVLFHFEANAMLPARAAIEYLDETRLDARLVLGPFEPGRHEAGEAVKAITWHQLRVELGERRARLEVILDL